MKPTLESAALAAVTLGLAASASAQVAPWTQLTLTTNPTARERPATATDGNVLYMYGGQSGTTTSTFANFWSFDGTNWTQVSATGTACGARCGAVMAWDAARGRLVVFSGKGAGGVWANFETTTWEWDSVNGWVPMSPTTVPDARWLTGGGAYVPGVGVVFHGGNAWNSTTSTTYVSNETWAWNGTDWTLLTNTGPAIQNGALVYRSPSNDLIYFGGVLSGGTGSGADTYRYDVGTNTWSQIVTATLPTSDVAGTTGPGLNGASAYYHPLSGKVVIHGGQGNHGTSVASKLTWEFDGVDWTDVSDPASPNIRNSSAQWISALGKADSSCGNSSNAVKNWTLEHDVPISCSGSVADFCEPSGPDQTDGCTPDVDWTGTPDVTQCNTAGASDFVVTWSAMSENKNCNVVLGKGAPVALAWSAESTRCFPSPYSRTGSQDSGGTGAGCTGSVSLDVEAYLQGGGLLSPVAAGDAFVVQVWYRDPASSKSTQMSDAATFTVCP